jgi:O-antigen/teichoic acid export membrane protein
MMLVSGPLQYVLYGQLAAAHHKDKALIRSTFLVITQVLAVAIFPPMGIVAAANRPVFQELLSTKWAAAGHVFMLVAPTCALQAVTSLCGTMLLVLGRADIRLKTTVESGIIWIICLVASVNLGIDAVAVMYDVVAFLYLPRTLSFVLPLIQCSASAYLRAIGVPIIITTICSGLYTTLTRLETVGDVKCLVAAAMLAALGVAVSGLMQRRAILIELALWRAADGHEIGSEVARMSELDGN